MCVIIDANVAHMIVGSPPQPEAAPLLRHILERKLGVVSGGKNAEELQRAGLGNLLQELSRAGLLLVHSREEVELEQANLARIGCASDDEHVIALARLSGARLLYSKDHALHTDFKDQRLLTNPRGRVYSSDKHVALLRRVDLCHR